MEERGVGDEKKGALKEEEQREVVRKSEASSLLSGRLLLSLLGQKC